ncbi:MAG: GlxA family transcriptional regulator [Gammaproteobacteria bacterium]|nr:GlxA family transcriptional regulator [Gammaproteobacteria bacterium]
MHITILVPGFGLPSPVVGPYEVFSSAGVLWNQLRGEKSEAPFEVITASVDGRPVRFAGGITVTPDKALGAIRKTDLVFVPTIGLELQKVLARNQAMLGFLRRQAARDTLIAGVCTGVSLLAEAGLLDGREATTHWALADEYRQRYPAVRWKPERFITASDNFYCGGGVYAALDLCLFLVERLAGYQVAKQTGSALLIDPPRTWQSSFSAPLLNQQHQDDKIRRAQDYLQENFTSGIGMDGVAQKVGMSTRNFTRRFRQATGETPLNYLHKLRINCAKQLLETDFKSVQEICYQVGYEDVPFFRQVFRRSTGLSPTDYRQRFGRRGPGDPA